MDDLLPTLPSSVGASGGRLLGGRRSRSASRASSGIEITSSGRSESEPPEEERPCVECGAFTVNTCLALFMRGETAPCYAEDRIPSEAWAWGQRTPMCMACEDHYEMCRFCRKEDGCSPRPWVPGDEAQLPWETELWLQEYWPCVECGEETTNYCNEEYALGYSGPCLAAKRMPDLEWTPGQRTPLCATCESQVVTCRFCRRVPLERPDLAGCESLVLAEGS